MTLLEAYLIFGIPIIGLLMGYGAVLLVRADYARAHEKAGTDLRP